MFITIGAQIAKTWSFLPQTNIIAFSPDMHTQMLLVTVLQHE